MSNKIESLYAVIAVDENGDEGICAWQVGKTWFPLVGSGEATLKRWEIIVPELKAHSKKAIKLINMTAREEVKDY